MNTQFIHCKNCGTRNFVDDKVCGVCKRKLSTLTNLRNQGQNQNTSKISPSAWILLIIVAFVCYAVFITPDNKKNSGPKNAVYNNELDASVSQVESYLKDNLNDPDSYSSVSWSEVFKLNDTKEVGFACYQVRHKYRAKNAFGAYVIEEKMFKLDYQGKIVDVKDYLR